MANIIKICEVCDNKKLLNVLDLGDHPLCDDLLEIGSKRNRNRTVGRPHNFVMNCSGR